MILTPMETGPDAHDQARPAPSLTVVVPCYRSPSTVAAIPAAVRAAVGDRARSIEFVFVDDGSPDDTWARLSVLAEEPGVRLVRLVRNYGQHNAIAAGLQRASGEVVLTLDDDLQTPPDQIPLLFDALEDDVDLVYGYPEKEPQSWWRNLASRGAKRLMSASLGPDVHPRASAFRLFRRAVLPVFSDINDPFVSVDVMLSWATTRVEAIPVRMDVRSEGASGYTLRRLARHTLNMVTGYSTAPLRLVALIGVAAAVLGFGLLIYVLARWILGDSGVPGFSFLAAALTLFSGVQLLCIGILGEYLGRVHFRSMGRPTFLVRTDTAAGPPTT